MKPYLLFDAGGTMLYPQADIITAVCIERNCSMDIDRFIHGFYGAIQILDTHLGQGLDTSWIPQLAEVALEQAGIGKTDAEAIIKEARSRCGKRNFWGYSPDLVATALELLKQAGYRMSVISNADGTVEQILIELGLAPYFERIFDSAIVGVEKPDRRIFDHALAQLGLRAAECIYIGDVFNIDVLGANGAGMAAVHIDPYGRYAQWPGYHVTSILDYAEQLTSGKLTLAEKRLRVFEEKGVAAGA